MASPKEPASGSSLVYQTPEVMPEDPDERFVSLCRSCERSGSCRLGVQSEWINDGILRARACLGAEHEGGRGIAHGGTVAALLDEICGHLCKLTGPTAVTQTLDIQFRHPVPIEQPLLLEGRSVSSVARGRVVAGRIALPASDVTLASATGRFIFRRENHYDRFDEWLQRHGTSR